MILEIIATSVQDATIAEANGADRIELISGFLEGGVTPSYGLIERTVRAVSIPVNVMVRPHSQSFCYDTGDIEVMCSDIRTIKQLGAAGIVIGMLDDKRHINRSALEVLLHVADGLDVTFHRAFDEIADQLAAVQVLLDYPQISRVLTSGGADRVLAGVEQIKRLVSSTSQTSLSIMAGSGLTYETVREFLLETSVNEVHFGTGVRVQYDARQPVDAQKVALLRERLRDVQEERVRMTEQ